MGTRTRPPDAYPFTLNLEPSLINHCNEVPRRDTAKAHTLPVYSQRVCQLGSGSQIRDRPTTPSRNHESMRLIPAVSFLAGFSSCCCCRWTSLVRKTVSNNNDNNNDSWCFVIQFRRSNVTPALQVPPLFLSARGHHHEQRKENIEQIR